MLFYFGWTHWYFRERLFSKAEKVGKNYFAKGLNAKQRSLPKLILYILDGNCRFSVSQ